jgi:hypothetical protein
MFRMLKIGAAVALATVIGAQAAAAQTLTWGVFRENAPSIAENLRNCWAQAMVSGQTINGEVMAQNLTAQKAQSELVKLAKQGLCAAQRTSTTWTARTEKQSGFGGSDDDDDDRRSFGGSHGGGSDSDRSGDDRSDGDSDRSRGRH